MDLGVGGFGYGGFVWFIIARKLDIDTLI